MSSTRGRTAIALKRRTAIGRTHHTLTIMKIYFGFQNAGDINRLSPALQALNVNLLKAAPGQVPLKGLHRIPQLGYASYAANLPAFIYATELGKPVPLTREGYPIITKMENMISLPLPPIYVTFRGQKDLPTSFLNKFEAKKLSVKDKSSRAYQIDYKAGVFGALQQTDYERGVYPIAGCISAEDLGTLITIVRIASGFLRTHKYPAFSTEEDYEHEFESMIDTSDKRQFTDDDDLELLEDGNPSKKYVRITVDGEPTWVKPEKVMTETVAKIHRAKPVHDDTPSWGDASVIPGTDGIVFPFLEELAAWDKETVCDTIGLYFVRCLGHTTDGCLKAHSDLSASWKRSIYRTPIGNALSHLYRVISIAIPAQARVFPVINGTQYSGSYLSGSGYSVALRAELLRPTSYENNKQDFDCFDSTDSLLKKILELVAGVKAKEKVQQERIWKMGSVSMRGLNAWLKTWILSRETIEKIRLIASRIRYPQEFLRINMTNIELALSWLKEGSDVDIEVPMHSHGLGRTAAIESIFSAFGPNAPSPIIPGSQRISVTPKPPNGFNKVLAFRTTTLETAIADWKKFGDEGFVYNGPDRLSGRYQYVQVRGEDDRSKWFSVLNGYHAWYKTEQRKNMDNSVVENEETEGVSISVGGTEGLDLSGF